MGSVQFQIVPYSNLYFFSRSIGPFQCLVNGNDRVLICCICHFQSSSLILFILASSVCQSLQCLICALTQGAHLFSCALGREEYCKQISLACVGSVRSVWTTLGLPQLTACMLSWSILLRLRVALQGNAKVGTGFRALPRLWEPKLFRFRF